MFINIPFVFQLLCWTSLSFSRQQCYKCILDCLQRLLVIKTTPSQSPGLPSRPGPPPAPDPSALTPHDAEKHVSSYEKKSLLSVRFVGSAWFPDLIFFLDGRCVIIFIVLRGWIMACYFVSMVDWQWTDWKAVGGKFYFRVPSYHSKSPCIFFIPQPFSICFTGKVGHQVVIGLVLYLIGSTGGASL